MVSVREKIKFFKIEKFSKYLHKILRNVQHFTTTHHIDYEIQAEARPAWGKNIKNVFLNILMLQ